MKTHFRSYSITDSHEVSVWDARAKVDLTSHYPDTGKRRQLRPDASLDIYRGVDGDITWASSANGHDVPAATSQSVLFDLFLQDLELQDGPRAF